MYLNVSEGLNSVETKKAESKTNKTEVFQKDLIVWKHVDIEIPPGETFSFRRT